MRLATIISDCGWANYSKEVWYSLSDDDWDKLMGELNEQPRLLANAITQYRLHSRTVEKIAERWRKWHEETYQWFIEPHPADWLGVIPRDIRGVIGEYLRIRLRVRNSTYRWQMVHNYVMAKRCGWKDEPEVAWIDPDHMMLHWSQDVKWVQFSDGMFIGSDHRSVIETDRELCGRSRLLIETERELCGRLHRIYSSMFFP